MTLENYALYHLREDTHNARYMLWKPICSEYSDRLYLQSQASAQTLYLHKFHAILYEKRADLLHKSQGGPNGYGLKENENSENGAW